MDLNANKISDEIDIMELVFVLEYIMRFEYL